MLLKVHLKMSEKHVAFSEWLSEYRKIKNSSVVTMPRDMISSSVQTNSQDIIILKDSIVYSLNEEKNVKKAGYIPGVYSSASYFESELNYSDIDHYEIWVARYVKDDVFYYPSGIGAINNCIALSYKYGGKYSGIKAGMWQYSSNGRISGISGNVDMNYTYKIY